MSVVCFCPREVSPAIVLGMESRREERVAFKKKKLLSTSKTGVVIGRQFTFSSTGYSPPRFLFRILKEAPSMAFLRSSDLHCL